ncbi:MAG: LLM class F420-dependent oxidoreductase [Actinobacteria bacterium]|nr:LLM class F420-dependent oxidoreductase [Actinomycetota bacterium]
MEVGVFVPIGTGNAEPDLLRALGPAIEERGFESVWVPEHVVLFDDYASSYPYAADGRMPGGAEFGMSDPLTALTFLAAVTDRIRLGTAICLLPQRSPVYTAKQAADLDRLSGGRFELGIGVGWLREEFEALGVPFERRGARTDEYLAVLRTLWQDDVSEHRGELYDLPPCRMYPKPVQTPHPPIVVGGESDAALRRVARHGDGWFSFDRLPEDLPEALDRLDAALDAEGRKRSDVTVTVSPYFKPVGPAEVAGYAELGVDRLVVVALAFDHDSMHQQFDALVAGVLEPARAG